MTSSGASTAEGARKSPDEIVKLPPCAVGPPAEELAQIPLGRMGSPREFGDVVCFIASGRAAYITGTTVLVDGGSSRGLV